MFKHEINCDLCEKEMDISQETITASDSIESLCELMDWCVIDFPENHADVPEKQYLICAECDEEEFCKKHLHSKCSIKEGDHEGRIYYCSECDKLYCEAHFDIESDLCLSCVPNPEEEIKENEKKCEEFLRSSYADRVLAFNVICNQYGKELASIIEHGVQYGIRHFLSLESVIHYMKEVPESERSKKKFLVWFLER